MEIQMQTPETIKIMNERFGHDSLIAFATCDNNIPSVSTVHAYYENGAFYFITHKLSEIIRQIEVNSDAAVSAECFSAHGKAVNMGDLISSDNSSIAQKLCQKFADGIDNGSNDLCNKNTCIICVWLTNGTLFSDGNRYDISFLMR